MDMRRSLASSSSYHSGNLSARASSIHLNSSLNSSFAPVEKDEDAIRLLQCVPEVNKYFEVIGKIGEGTFSSVYKAKVRGRDDTYFALKYLIPTSHPSRIANELKCLRDIGGSANVIDVKTCFYNKGHVVIVMSYFPHERFSDYVRTISLSDAKAYLYNLLVALERVHAFRVIHRDIKPSNFLFDRASNRYVLVDFGLAQKFEETAPSDKGKKRNRSADQENSSSSSKRACGSSVALKPSSQVNSTPGQHDFALPSTSAAPNTTSNVAYSIASSSSSRSRMLAPPPVSQRSTYHQVANSSTSQSSTSASTSVSCNCFGRYDVCSICLARPAEVAPRAGTPGFRAPEVLMKSRSQTWAIDIWSAGVIFLSLLSGRYPFFRAHDDLTALAEIIAILGTQRVAAAALAIGKQLTMSSHKDGVDLKLLCENLRGIRKNVHASSGYHQWDPSWYNVPDSAYDLLWKLLDPNPLSRPSARDALQHEFFSDMVARPS